MSKPGSPGTEPARAAPSDADEDFAANRRRRFRRLVVPALLTILVVAVFADWSLRNLRRAQLGQQLIDLAGRGIVEMASELAELRSDIAFIAQSPAAAKVAESEDIEALAALFTTLGRSQPNYTQLRWIDETGQERLRLNREDAGMLRVPDAQLQEKRHRDYFELAANLPPGSVYVSRIGLNQERGVIEIPYRPTLRAATPLYASDGRRRGILIINMGVAPLVERLHALSQGSFEMHVLDEEGFWVVAPERGLQWGHDIGNGAHRLAVLAPRVWQAFNERPHQRVYDRNGLWAMIPISGRNGLAVDGDVEIRSDDPAERRWFVAAHLPGRAEWMLLLAIDALVALVALLAIARSLYVGWRLADASAARDVAMQETAAKARALAEAHAEQAAALQREREMQAQLVRTAKLSSLGLMVAGVAHELNTPLGSASLLRATLAEARERLQQRLDAGLRRRDLDDYLADVREQLALLEEALDIAAARVRQFRQLAVDRSALERRRFTVDEVIESLRHTLRLRDARYGARLRVLREPEVAGGMLGYPGPLGQVLENLVLNAFEHAYADASGEVRLRVTRDAGRGVAFAVEDDGRGIASEDRERIFDPFFTTRRHLGGTGLGLHLINQLVHEVLGGELELHSEPGHGSRFIVRLPSSAADPA